MSLFWSNNKRAILRNGLTKPFIDGATGGSPKSVHIRRLLVLHNKNKSRSGLQHDKMRGNVDPIESLRRNEQTRVLKEGGQQDDIAQAYEIPPTIRTKNATIAVYRICS